MRQDRKSGGGAPWAVLLALLACLDFALVSCEDRGSWVVGASEGNWQRLYAALSEEERSKVGEGLRSVVTLGFSKETIVGSVFDSTYAIDASGGGIFFYIRADMDSSDISDEIQDIGLVVESEASDSTHRIFHTKATFVQIVALAKVEPVSHVEAETDWHRAFRMLSEEERKKLDSGIYVIGNSSITKERIGGSVFAERWAIDTRGEEPLFHIRVTTNKDNAFNLTITFLQIVELAKQENMLHIELVPRARPLKPELRRWDQEPLR